MRPFNIQNLKITEQQHFSVLVPQITAGKRRQVGTYVIVDRDGQVQFGECARQLVRYVLCLLGAGLVVEREGTAFDVDVTRPAAHSGCLSLAVWPLSGGLVRSRIRVTPGQGLYRVGSPRYASGV